MLVFFFYLNAECSSIYLHKCVNHVVPLGAFGLQFNQSDPQFMSNILAFTEGKVEGGSYFHCREEGRTYTGIM